MRVGAVVLTYQDVAAVQECLRGLGRQEPPPAVVTVVDNDPATGTADALHREFPHVQVLAMGANVGYGAAMNAGAAACADDVDALLFLTHDCVLDAGALLALCAALVADPELAAVGPLLRRNSRADEVWSAGGDLVGAARRPRHRWSGHPASACTSGAVERCAWLDGAALLVRRDRFISAGMFRDDLFLYWEDVDFSLRLADSGWGVACVLDARAGQEPSMVPPYLMARNKLRVLWGRRDRLGVLATVGEVLALAVRDGLRGRRAGQGWHRARARLTGLSHAVSGRLDRTLAGLR